MSDLVKRLVESKKEDAEKTPPEQKEDEKAEAPKVKPPGIPIDQPVKPAQAPADTKRSILEAAVKKVNEEEKKILDKFGGTIVEMDKVPGNEGKDYKNAVFVNAPKNPEKFVDKDGKPVPPRIVYYFHGNGGKIGDSARAIMDQVERMRSNGENVILVMPQDNRGHWKDMENPQAFKDMQKMVESMTGGKPIKDISISSFSGGYKGVEKVLKNLRENSDKDPESKKLYKNIRQLGFLDSAYGGAEEFAEWAKDRNHTLFSNYTAKCENGNRMLEEAVRKARGGDMEGITITGFDGIHGNAPLTFEEAMKKSEVPIENVEITSHRAHIPERAPDAMTTEQFKEALRACKSEDEKKALYMDQLAKGNVPDRYREFQEVKVKVGDDEIGFSVASHGFGFGDKTGEFVEPAFDGLLASAVADATNCILPSQWLVEQREIQPHAQRVHFSHQGEWANELGLSREVTHGAKTWSADFILKNDEKIKDSAKKRGYDWSGLVVGYNKTVILRENGVNNPGSLALFGGLYDNGSSAQGNSGNFHDEKFHDYSQGALLVERFITKNGVKLTPEEARNDRELMGHPHIAKLINAMLADKPEYDYGRDPILRDGVERIKKGSKDAPAVTSANPPPPGIAASKAQTSTPSQPSSPAQPSSGSPQYAPSSSTGSYSGGGFSGPSTSPETYSEAAAPSSTPEATTESTPEPAKEHVETAISNKRYILGDSLSMGFAPYLKSPNTVHLHSKNEKDSTGAHTAEMLTALQTRVQNENVEGATLVIVGGTNDIFGPGSLEGIKKNLNAIYTLAKEKGMKVVAATLPPVGYSTYAKDNWAYHKSRFPSYEEYNDDLIKRWRELNTWITGRKGIKDELGSGPDDVVEFHKVLENPELPGSLSKDNYGQGGIHLKDYSVMGNALRDAVAALNPPGQQHETPADTAEAVRPTTEKPSSTPETIGPLSITSETKVDIQPANKPTKDTALGQNAEIRKNISGYSGLQQVSPEVGSLARELLGTKRFGDIVYFTDGTNEYVAVKEWHPPYDSTQPNKPQNWHHGISVMKKNA